jgi:hypothetical protein
VLAKRKLVSHPDCAGTGYAVSAKVSLIGSDVLKIEYVVIGSTDALIWPEMAMPERVDELWKTTCFEAFIALGNSYVEYNFSPSRRWASYVFEDYREGMQDALELPAPDIFIEPANSERFAMTVILDLSMLVDRQSLGLSAVLEHKTGERSYWALAHPPGKPDFHHRDCFALQLPAAGEL